MAKNIVCNDPPYNDLLSDNEAGKRVLNDNEKLDVLKASWNSVHEFTFPNRYCNGKFRKIQARWFNEYTWLRYSSSKQGVYCADCFLFAGNVTRSLVSSAASDPSNLGKMLASHAKSDMHVKSTEASENFRLIMSGEKKDILSSMSSSYNALVEKNRQILIAIVETIIVCGRQNLALRGHEEERGNFVVLLEFQATHNPVLKKHIENGDPRTKYTSNKIQNEIIDICGESIKQDIVDGCNRAPFFGFIADEATDASTMEQMALCLRYFDREAKSVTKNFIGFVECESTTGESLSEAFLGQLRDAGVNVEKMRGQGYDGASNMSGKFRGVQARIRETFPGAIYTHCRAHCLNLAICHASEEPIVRNMMSTVQEVASCFTTQQNDCCGTKKRSQITQRTARQ